MVARGSQRDFAESGLAAEQSLHGCIVIHVNSRYTPCPRGRLFLFLCWSAAQYSGASPFATRARLHVLRVNQAATSFDRAMNEKASRLRILSSSGDADDSGARRGSEPGPKGRIGRGRTAPT